jgi:elongation factor P--(R)-beta-lysine ligase
VLTLSGLHGRAALLYLIRQFFAGQGFIEVDTPLRLPVAIPERHIELFTAEEQYLQASPELCMKRLLARGATSIFQLGHCFRKGERGRLHLEEFTLLEWYRAGSDYRQLMDDCRDLCLFLHREWPGEPRRIETTGVSAIFAGIDLHCHWEKLTVREAFDRFSPVSLSAALDSGRFDEFLCEFVEPRLGLTTPSFLYDYPVELASLSRRKQEAPHLAERFELYVKGVELANGFSELNDQGEQRQRFDEEIRAIRSKSGCDVPMPEAFLRDLEKMPEAAGIALGVDRLAMLAFELTTISQATTFSPEDFR